MTKFRRTAIGGATAVIAGSALAATAFVAPTAADVLTPNLIEPTAGETQINLIGMNDFHGRILDGEDYAATVLTAQQQFGEENSLVFTVGDHVGASLFESSILNDQPTIDILNELGVDAFTQGNHEFDKGADDAVNRIAPATDGPDLAANVVGPDGTKPFESYAIFDVNGVSVAVIGAVTQETPSLVRADLVEGYTFTDPVEAVNEAAAEITAAGTADVIVASYHEGGALSNVPLEDNVASSEIFNSIVNETSPEVSAIYTAHSHRTYAYDAPNGDGPTRPVVQGGEYAGNIAQVVLTVDENNEVTAADSSIVPTMSVEDVPADVQADERLANIRTIVAQAVEDADEAGSVQVGTINGDVTRAKEYDESGAVSVEDDRSNASSLGDVVATSMADSVGATGRTVDLALMNPGGLRTDLIDDDGVITYKDAATVLPFANNLSLATLSGATLKQVLEQQWQTDADGNVPSRPYLQLGISDGFTYTYDSTRPEGDRITGMYIQGEAVAEDGSYNVVAPTFLTAGGDNFRAFTDSTEIADTGLIDLDAFVSWVSSQEGGVEPNQQRNSFEVAGFPTAEPIQCGDSATFTVSKIDLGSVDAIENTELTATAYVEDQDGNASEVDLGTAAVTDGAAELTITVPEEFLTDTFEIVLQAQPSESYVVLPIQVSCTDDGGSTPVPSETVPVPSETTSPAPTTPAPEAGDDDLAATGEDSNVMFFGIAAALAVLALGGTLLLIRRRASAE
ncbi:MAG: bifunctional metallophosphatase/5'-nucleotidase [Pseudoclavibacter sp.]